MKLRILALGESTFCGYYNGQDHKQDYDACIPLMVKGAVEWFGYPCELENKAVSSTSVDWHLGIKDGDESQYEPELSTSPATPYNLAKSPSNVVIINFGINDAVFADPLSFRSDFYTLIDNCKRTGKIVFVTMPNKINNGYQLTDIAGHIKQICDDTGTTCVNNGLQQVEMNDDYHPTPKGYRDLGCDLKNAVEQQAQDIIQHKKVTQYYVSMFNRTPEKSGLDYWVNDFNGDWNVVANSIISTIEGELSDDEFLFRIYNNLMNRDPDTEGHDYWMGRSDVTDKGTVMNEILDVLNDSDGQDHYFLQNRTSVGLAYGYIYGIDEVALTGNLSMVSDDFQTVYDATGTLI